MDDVKISSNRSFGIVFFIVFFIIAIWPLIDSGSIRVWSAVLSLIFLILGILNSKLLSPFKSIWIKLGEIIGKIIAPIVMGFIYFFIITPMGIFEFKIPSIRKTKDNTIDQILIDPESIIGQIAIRKNTIKKSIPKLLLFSFFFIFYY